MNHCFSVDVEDWYQVDNLATAIPRSSWSQRENRITQNMERLLQIFDDFDIKVTFFIFGKVAREYPDLIRKIASN